MTVRPVTELLEIACSYIDPAYFHTGLRGSSVMRLLTRTRIRPGIQTKVHFFMNKNPERSEDRNKYPYMPFVGSLIRVSFYRMQDNGGAHCK